LIEQHLAPLLLADSAIAALVGDRIFPVVVRQDTALPALTYARLGSERTYVLAGAAHWTTVQIGVTAWAPEYAQARALADAVRQALDGYTGTTGIEVASVQDGADEYESTLDVFGCTLNVTVQFSEE
jgi:hypothetical protein